MGHAITFRWFAGVDDLADAYAVRRAVFIEEQGVPEEIEIDAFDREAEHLVIYQDGLPVATGRIIVVDGDLFIGRVAVMPPCRDAGLGRRLMVALLTRAFTRADVVYLHAQVAVEGFYSRLGFTTFGEPFEEAGIPHLHMRALRPAGEPSAADARR